MFNLDFSISIVNGKMDDVIYLFKSSHFKELLNQTYQQQLKIYQYILAFNTYRYIQNI